VLTAAEVEETVAELARRGRTGEESTR